MQNIESQEVVARFFDAVEMIIEDGLVDSHKDLYDRLKIDRRNLQKLKDDHARDLLQLFWLSRLVRDFDVSAEWLLTGRGRRRRIKSK